MEKGKLINDGGEGYIYEVIGSPHLLVKEFKDADSTGSPIVTDELVRKLKYMCENPPEALVARGEVAWPSELIYNTTGELKGFYMPRLDFHEHINRALRIAYDENDINDGYPEQFDITFDFVPRMCEKANCDICLFAEENKKEESKALNKNHFMKYCIKTDDKICPVLLRCCGYSTLCRTARNIDGCLKELLPKM